MVGGESVGEGVDAGGEVVADQAHPVGAVDTPLGGLVGVQVSMGVSAAGSDCSAWAVIISAINPMRTSNSFSSPVSRLYCIHTLLIATFQYAESRLSVNAQGAVNDCTGQPWICETVQARNSAFARFAEACRNHLSDSGRICSWIGKF